MKKEKKKKIMDIKTYPKVQINFNPEIPPLRKLKDSTKVNVRYALIAPFTYAHVHWDNKQKELLYEIEEPLMTEREKEQKAELTTAMREILNFEEIIEKDKNSLIDYIDRVFRVLAIELDMDLTYDSFKRIFYYLVRDFVGFNETDPILKDYFVEDIECNGANSPVYLVHRIYRNLKTSLIFKDEVALGNFVEKLAQRSGKYVSYAQPILDSSLPDGSRVNATYTKDISSKGPTYTIRKFTKTPWTPPQLISFKTLSAEMLAYIWLLIQYKMNLLIAGGTASGKTTLLNAIAFFISPESRVVSIEDTRELNLPRENWLPSVVRTSTGLEKIGEVDLFRLLKASFRQNPDYVIVGEVRGKEAYVLFQGMASGHSSISTLHADSVDTVIKRLETPPIELSPTLVNVLDCVCVMTHAVVKNQETRRLKELVEVVNVSKDGVATTNTPFTWNAEDDKFYFKKDSKIFEKITKDYGLTKEEILREFRTRVKIIYKMNEKKIFDFDTVQEIISGYYKEPKAILKKLGIREEDI